MPIKSQVPPTMVPTAAPPAMHAGQSDMHSMSKDKGKGCALPGPYTDEVPAGILSYKEDPYGYNLTFDSNEFNNEYTAKELPTLMLNTVEHVSTFISGTASVGALLVPQEWEESWQYSAPKP